VASGARARWVERVEGHDDLATIGELEPRFFHVPHGPAGVSFESAAGGMRHGIGERSAETKRRTEDFAREIAASLNEQQARGEFDRLGLIAPTRMLRSIRGHLSEAAHAKVHFEIARDLSKQPNHALKDWLHNPAFS
jgi:hypothetical protein